MHRKALLAVGLVLVLAILACGGSSSNPPAQVQAPRPPTATPIPRPIGVCDSQATEIDYNQTFSFNMPRATGGYPTNCQRWCIRVPEGGTSLRVDIFNFTVDLDLYMANTFAGITGNEVAYGESYTWMDRDGGAGIDEGITIPNPDGGTFYLEVCSYNGDPSPYGLSTHWLP